MSYKPKYCNQCAEKIERASWSFTTSRRFCDLCATNFGFADWTPRITFCASLILAIVLAGILLRAPEKNLVVSSNQSPNNSPNVARNLISQSNAAQNTNAAIAQTANVNLDTQPKQLTAAALKSSEKIKATDNRMNAAPQETVYFCGAQTLKGTPCTRRVKGASKRCWQHAGQAAMLPPEKLIAN